MGVMFLFKLFLAFFTHFCVCHLEGGAFLIVHYLALLYPITINGSRNGFSTGLHCPSRIFKTSSTSCPCKQIIAIGIV